MRARRDAESGELLLTIADTGVGIAEEDQVAVFEKFRQGQAVMAQGDAITREYSGTGLGLSIVKELCKLLGRRSVAGKPIGARQHVHGAVAVDACRPGGARYDSER